MDERRRFIRFSFKMKAELTVQDNLYEADDISDLSIGGCLLSINADLEPGTPCTLKIILRVTGNEPNVKIEGSITRCKEGKVAIQFTRIDPDSLAHLQKIARYNSPDPERVEREIQLHPGIK